MRKTNEWRPRLGRRNRGRLLSRCSYIKIVAGTRYKSKILEIDDWKQLGDIPTHGVSYVKIMKTLATESQ